MMIRYANGTTQEGLLLSQRKGTLRAAVKGINDALVFRHVRGAWMAESREPVEIQLEWQRRPSRALPDRADCVYSQDWAQRLVRVLQASQPALTRRRAVLSRPS